MLDPAPKDSDLVGLVQGPRICISDMPGDAEAAGPWTTLEVARAYIIDKPSWVGSFYLNFTLTTIEKLQHAEFVTT